MPSVPAPPVRVLYRHYGGENTKPRPVYYSKLLALASLLRAAEQLDRAPELVFVTDQVRPGPVLSLMEAHGEVVQARGGSDARSLRWTFDREAGRVAPRDQFLWFAEDDYLYRPDVLVRLEQGARELTSADYLTVYGSSALDVPASRRRVVYRSEPGAGPGAVELDGIAWYPAAYATSTFGTRAGTLREDLRLLELCSYSGGAWDQTTWMVACGLLPFSAAELAVDVWPAGSTPPSGWPKAWARGAVRTVVQARSLRRPSRRRTLWASDPELVHHMEDPAPGAERVRGDRHEPSPRTAATDWSALAAETTAWACDRGIVLGTQAHT